MPQKVWKLTWTPLERARIQKMRRDGKTPEEIMLAIRKPEAYLDKPYGVTSLCSSCQEAVPSKRRGCSWSRSLKPVEGCTTQPSTNRIRSLCIINCPKLNPDPVNRYRRENITERSWIAFLHALTEEV